MDLEDVEFESVMLRKIATKHGDQCTQDISKNKIGLWCCSPRIKKKAHWDTRLRDHEDLIAEQVYNSLSLQSSHPRQAKGANAAFDRKWRSSRDCGHGEGRKSKAKKEVIEKGTQIVEASSLGYADGRMPLLGFGVGAALPSKTILGLTQYSQSKDRQHHK